jgi:peptidyl-prolyl cis-trans isomerase C
MRVMMGRWALGTAVVLAICAVAFPAAAEEAAPSDDKVAAVNGTVISKADLEKEVGRLQWQYSMMGKPAGESEMAEMRKEALEKLIENELLYQESKRQDIKVDEAEIERHVATMRKRFPTEAEFEAALEKMNISVDELTSQFTRGRAIQQLIEGQVADKVTVSEEEEKTFYDSNPELFMQPEQVKASHILIKVEPDADESKKAEAREELEEISQKLEAGEDFAELAKEFSQGPSGPGGGDLGYFGHGQMVKPFEEAAFALEPGAVSDIVETRFGYHLIKVVDKRGGDKAAYEDIKDRLAQYLKQQKLQEEVELYVKKLKEEAEVERFVTQ